MEILVHNLVPGLQSSKKRFYLRNELLPPTYDKCNCHLVVEPLAGVDSISGPAAMVLIRTIVGVIKVQIDEFYFKRCFGPLITEVCDLICCRKALNAQELWLAHSHTGCTSLHALYRMFYNDVNLTAETGL